MAAVTLKDLMNPLTKIEEHTKQTSEKLTKIEELLVKGVGVSNSVGGIDISALITRQDIMIEIQSAILQQLSAQTIYLKIISKGGKKGIGDRFSSIFGKKERGTSNIKESVGVLEKLGIGIKELGKGLLIWTLIPKKIITKFSFFITETFSALTSQNSKKVKKGVLILDMMGGAIFKFSKALALSALLLIPSMIAIPFLITSITIMGLTVSILGSDRMSKRIKRGAKNLDRIGDGILSFGIGLAAFALTTFLILSKPILLVGMIASILLIGGAVSLIGGPKMSKRIVKGSLALLILGPSLAIFSLGYLAFSLVTRNTSLGDVLIQGAVILGIGIATALVGKIGFTNIGLGALALSLNGLGLLVFSLGYVPFAEATKGIVLKDVLVQSGVLLAIGTVMALAGLAVAATAGAALLGPVLFGAAGASLLLLAPGLDAMKRLDYTEADSKDLAITLGAVAMAFSGVNPEKGPLGMIGGLFTRVVQSGSGLAAAGMYAAAGVALQELSKGLSSFKTIKFTEDDSKDLAIALGSVSAAFSEAGGEPVNPGGYLGKFFGNAFSPNATERGINSVKNAGESLISVVEGLKSFLDLKSKYGLTSESFQKGGFLNKAITESLGFVQTAFALIGGEENVDAGGFFGSVFNFKRNKVAEGINSVKGAGEALKDIVIGLSEFQTLVDQKIDFTKLGESIITSLTYVGDAFAIIGGNEREDSAFFGLIKWDENVIRKGIKAVKGAGLELKTIAEGLVKFEEIKDPTNLAKSISDLINSIGSTFVNVYETDPLFKEKSNHFAEWITKLGKVAKDKSLEKAAEDLSDMSDAINSVEIEKLDSFNLLFKSAADISNGSIIAFSALTNAVEEIRDILAETVTVQASPTAALPTASPATTVTGNTNETQIQSTLNRINFTMDTLNSTMSNLPSNIAAIEIKVPID